MNWRSLSVDRVIVHYVPTARDEEDPQLLLTDEEIPLDGALKGYFRDKIADRLEAKGLEVVSDVDRDQTVPDGIAQMIARPSTLVEVSKRFATRLNEIQTGSNSSGLVAVVACSLDGDPCISVLKLERERGIRFAIETRDGHYVADMELLRNLTLTDKTKVYKTALLRAGASGASVNGFVADDQRRTTEGVQVASFFLSEFLGCKPKAPAAKTTYDFVRIANATINRDVEIPERKGRYQVALLVTMQDQRADIRPATFANQNLEPEDRAHFNERLREAGIDPNTTFAKDTSLVRVSEFKMTFESGMVLVGSKEALEEKVDLPEAQGAGEPVTLNDTVKSVITGR